MSTNRKNRNKPVLRNLIKSQNIAQRKLLTLETKLDSSVLKEIVDEINEVIQDLNCSIAERNIPYIRIEQSFENYNIDKTRVFLRTEVTDTQALQDIERAFNDSSENTFFVELYLNHNGYVEIGYSDEASLTVADVSNGILIDYDYLICALTDIFVDSAMFNSYSFLKSMSNEEKREFNKIKVDFLKAEYLDFTEVQSQFYIYNNKYYKYLSMAFFARQSKDELDLDLIIRLWNQLICSKYRDKIHVEPPVANQICSLQDHEQYSDKIKEECMKLPKGTYWLLRIHRKPNPKVIPQLIAVFGVAVLGTEKIIPFESFPLVEHLVKEQHITAFKIIVQ